MSQIIRNFVGSRKMSFAKNIWPSRKLRFATCYVFFVVLLSSSAETVAAHDPNLAPLTFAAAQTAKQQCTKTCRDRYRDCRRLNQLPSFECKGVYKDCTRYSCTGLGPG